MTTGPHHNEEPSRLPTSARDAVHFRERVRLQVRIARLKSGFAHAQEPKSRMRRLVSNLVLTEETTGEILASSNFLLAELRRGKQDVFAGRTLHRLRPQDGSFKLVSKKVLLVNNDEPIDNLTFLI